MGMQDPNSNERNCTDAGRDKVEHYHLVLALPELSLTKR